MNGFVTYLNSLNNASGSNENALAEAQVVNKYYEKFHIDRNLGVYLAAELRQKPMCVILTGHAGDGKTSLIYQILKTFNIFNQAEGLKQYDTIYSDEINRNLFYIKDMSELRATEQTTLLKKAIDGAFNETSSIVVSNTGPLITTFKQLVKDGEILGTTEDKVEMQLLKEMDENKGMPVKIGEYEILLINMARIDNVVLVPKLINRMIDEEFWEDCKSCKDTNSCSIYTNYLSIKENKENVSKVVTSYYRWLFESDRRLTVRQILAQLSFAITGNQTCGTMGTNFTIDKKFKYHFGNLFFGYSGLMVQEEALQIKAINELQQLALDSRETKHDYDFFVKNDFENLTDTVREVVEEFWNRKLIKYKFRPVKDMQMNEPYELRKSIRRMNILFGRYDNEGLNGLVDELFAPVFSRYLNYRDRKWNVKESRNMKTTLFKALHYIFVGIPPEKGINKIYLPLQRQGVGMQNVQLLLGELTDSDIVIIQKNIPSVFDAEENHYELFIKFSNNKEYKISLMLLDYFDRIAKGSVSTKINPSLSHGIDKMKSKIFSDYKYQDTQEIIHLLIHTLKGPKLINMQIDNEELFVD